MGKSQYLQKSKDRPPKPIYARMYVQDPLVAKQHGASAGIKRVKLDGEPFIGAGPTTSRVAVVDYNGDLDTVFAPAGALARGGGFDVGKKSPRDNFQFHQVNVWAAITRALNHLESPKIFGRRIPWAFRGGRLLVLPHAGYMENAFYDRGSGALHFFYFMGPAGKPVFTCLSHDIVTHELGHAVLDGLKPLYNEITSADVGAFHEYFGDALAMTAALTLREVVVAVVGKAPTSLSGRNLVSDIAKEFGVALGSGDSSLRSAAKEVTFRDVASNFEEHDRSEVLSGIFYRILQDLYRKEMVRQKKKRNKKPGQRAVAALINAAGYTSRMMLRGLDYCPPAGLSFKEYARAVVRADEVAYPVDSRNYRKTVRDVFRKRGIVRSDAELDLRIRLDNEIFRTYDIDRVAASPTDAYEFVDANREDLRIPRNVNFSLHNLYETKKIAAKGYFPPREIVLEFTWSEDVTLRGARFGAFKNGTLPLWCGGTLVFDKAGNVLHYAAALKTDARVKELRDYIAYLIREGAIGATDGERGLGAQGLDTHRVAARVEGGRLRLRRNPSLRHESSKRFGHA